MRLSLLLPLVLGGVLCLGGAARGQSDSRMEQILHPSTERAFDLTREKSFGTKDYDGRSKKVLETKSTYLPQKFNAKTYLTGSFHNDKSFWLGDFKYSVGDANTTPHSSFLRSVKSFQTKNAPVKDAPGIKNYSDASTSLPTRDYRGSGAFASATDSKKLHILLTPEQAAKNGYEGSITELKSVDDVRALLNKSK